MMGNPRSLTEEFLNLLKYLAGCSDSNKEPEIRPKHGSPPNFQEIPQPNEATSREEQLCAKLERDLVSWLDKYDIYGPSSFDFAELLSKYELYFKDRNKVPFGYIKNLIKSTTLGPTQMSSVMELLYLLRNNGMNSLSTSKLSEFYPPPRESFSEYKDALSKTEEELQVDDLISSQLREMYYSPLKLDSDTESLHTSLPPASDTSESDVLLERELVLDIIYMLKGDDGKYFKRMGGEYMLSDSKLKVPCDMKQLTSKFCTLAKMYHSIKNINLESNLLTRSLLQALIEEIDDYNSILDLILLNFGEGHLSLLQLYSIMQKPYRKIRTIYILLNSDSLSLNDLYDNIFKGDTETRGLFSRVLTKSLVPFFEVVYKWLYSGELSYLNVNFFVYKVDEEYHFDESKVFKFFPLPLAFEIFEKGKLSHYLKRLKRNLAFPSLKTFLDQVCKEEKWSFGFSITSLKQFLSQLTYSEEITSALLDEYKLSEHLNLLCSQFTHLNLDFKKLDPSHGMSVASEYGLKVYYPNRTFPYTLVIEDNYKLCSNLINLSALFRVAVDLLNEGFRSYLWYYKYNNGILGLSPFLNKINVYRSEMLNFMFTMQPFQDSRYYLYCLTSSLKNCRKLEDLKNQNANFIQSLNAYLVKDLANVFKNVIDFAASMLDIFKGNMEHLHKISGDMDPDSLVDYMENRLVDYATTWSCLKSAESFRENVLKILSKPGPTTLLDLNNYYKLNYPLKPSYP